MKVLWYVKGVADAHLAHGLATILRQSNPKSRFFALAYRESGEGFYLRNNAADVFEAVLTESEMYRHAGRVDGGIADKDLARIETLYGIPTLWQYVTHDRWLSMQRSGYLFEYGTDFSAEGLLAHVLARFELTEQFVSRSDPDLVIYAGTDVGPSSALVLWSVAREKGIPVLVPLHTRVASYITLSDSVFSETHAMQNHYRDLRRSGCQNQTREKAVALLEGFRHGTIYPSYMKRFLSDGELQGGDVEQSRQGQRHAHKKPIGQSASRLMRYFRQGGYRDPLRASWVRRRHDTAVMRVRRAGMRFSGVFSTPSSEDKYVYYPLHVEPEMSLLLYAPFWMNQYAIVQNLAQSMPYDTRLYVKEHPALLGSRPVSYYKQLAAIPNVRLISPFADSRQMIRNSLGVITVTGTAGLEAVLIGKPVITLGDAYYNFLDDAVWHTHSPEDVPALVKGFAEFKADETLIIDFLATIIETAIQTDLRELSIQLAAAYVTDKQTNPALLDYASFLMSHMPVATTGG